MFSFGRIFKKCSGCQVLWSDPNKQAGAYDAVSKDDKEEKEDPDMEPLSPIVFSQPGVGRKGSWSLDMESPIVRNQSPIVKNSKSSSLERNQPFVGNDSPIVKTRTPPRDAFSLPPVVKTRAPPRNSFNGENSGVKSKTPPKTALKASASNDRITDTVKHTNFLTSASTEKISETDKSNTLLSSSSPNLVSKPVEYGAKVHASKSSKKAKKSKSELALQVVSVV